LLLTGYWYAANAWRSGNALYPLQVSVFGRTLLTGWHDSKVMALSPYFIDPRDLNALADMLMQVLDPRLAPLWVGGLLAGGWLAARGTDPRTRQVIRGLAVLAVLNLAIYWLAIPYRTQQRFMFHGVALAAVPLAALLDRARWLRLAAVALLALHVLTPMSWPWAGGNQPDHHARIPWDRSEMIPNALPALVIVPTERLGGSDPLNAWIGVAAVLGVGGLSLAAAAVAGRAIARPSPGRWVAAAWAFGLLLAVGGLLSYPRGSLPRDRFYAGFRDYYAGWMALDRLSGEKGSRLAYAGTNLPYFLLGPGLKNRVSYVNVDGRPDWLMHDYHRRAVRRGRPNWPDPRPGWDREEPDAEAWLANLRENQYQLLVVARHNVGEPWPIERGWADSRPGTFTCRHGDAEADPLFRIYAIRWP